MYKNKNIDFDIKKSLTDLSIGNRRLYGALQHWFNLIPSDLFQLIFNFNHSNEDCKSIRINPECIAHKQLFAHLHYSCHSKLYNHPLANELRKERVQNAFKNKRLKNELNSVLGQLQQKGMKPIVFKGADLAYSVYPDPCCRMIGDVDLLIAEEEYDSAIKVMINSGWSHHKSDPMQAGKFHRRITNWIHPEYGITIDMQDHANHYAIWPTADEMHFKDAVYESEEGREGYWALCKEHALVQVCCHGMAQNYHPHVRWVPDAVWILKKGGENFDWDKVLSAVQITNTSPIIYVSLAYLHFVLGVDIPRKILNELKSGERNKGLIWAWSYRLKLPSTLWEQAVKYFSTFYVAQPERNLGRCLISLPEFLCANTQSSSIVGAFRKLAKKIVSKYN